MSTGPDYSGLVVPDLLVGAVRAYREWRVPDPLRELVSLRRPVSWPTVTLRAECHRPPGIIPPVGKVPLCAGAGREIPDVECTCGIYGYWVPDVDMAVAGAVVSGVVEVRGRCVIGSRGLRAQEATIVALAPSPLPTSPTRRKPLSWTDVAPSLAGHYPTARLYDTAEAMLAEWPATPPVDLIGVRDD